ncbi:hypothetical protein KCU78_g10460, partial [Aureobasidium melanogenum]
MDDSSSDTSHDEVKSAFYKITPEEMCKMKHSLEITEGCLSSLWVITGCAHIDPILNEFKVVKTSITDAQPASENIITPEASDSDSVLESDKPPSAICATLVEGEPNLSSYPGFFKKFDDGDCDEDYFFTVVERAIKTDSEFVNEFEIRIMKIISDYIICKMKDALVKDLTETFSKM